MEKFNKLTILETYVVFKANQKRKYAKCLCDCGNIKEIYYDSVIHNKAKSCGCYGISQRLKSNSKYTYNEYFFNPLNNLSSYVLGLLYTDGNLSDRRKTFSISLHKQDVNLIENIGLLIKNSKTYNIVKKANNVSIFFTNKKMYQDLLDLGLYPNKSTTLTIPDYLLYNKNFWRGCVDGDGSLFISKNSLYLSLCGTRNICESFLTFCKSLGINSKATVRSKKGYSFDFCEIQFSGKNAVAIAEKLYEDNSYLRIERKYQNFLNYKSANKYLNKIYE
jgi:hypothetical protein